MTLENSASFSDSATDFRRFACFDIAGHIGSFPSNPGFRSGLLSYIADVAFTFCHDTGQLAGVDYLALYRVN